LKTSNPFKSFIMKSLKVCLFIVLVNLGINSVFWQLNETTNQTNEIKDFITSYVSNLIKNLFNCLYDSIERLSLFRNWIDCQSIIEFLFMILNSSQYHYVFRKDLKFIFEINEIIIIIDLTQIDSTIIGIREGLL
jgi:predicted PurR-regulated permease PerM